MKRLLLLLLPLALLLASCVPEEPQTPVDDGTWKASLLAAHEADRNYTGQTKTPKGTSIFFSGGISVNIPNDAMPVDDCLYTEPRKAAIDANSLEWTLDGKPTGIAKQWSSSLNTATPVYAWVDIDGLKVMYNTGETICFRTPKDVPDQPDEPVEPEDPEWVGPKPIPRVYLTTNGGAAITSKTKYVRGTFRYVDTAGIYPGPRNITDSMQIRGRGNTTWSRFPKKPWKVKLDNKAKVFGLSKDRDWAMLANYSDKTLLRNIVCMEISRRVGFDWTPQMYNVEVWLNGDYVGVYNFSEHKEVAGGRVDIDVDKGWMYLEVDKGFKAPVHFNTGMKIPVNFKDPEAPTQGQQDSLKAFLADMEAVLKDNSLRADPEKGYAAYVDVDTFINYFIVEELVKNIDGKFNKSTFLTKAPGGRIRVYHLWDFDLAIGNCNYFTSNYPKLDSSPYGFAVRDYTHNGENTGWLHYMFLDPAFQKRVRDRWDEVKPQLATIPAYIDEQVALLGDSVDRNFQRWPILDQTVWPNVQCAGSYAGEINYLKWFYTERLAWMDANL